MLPARVAATEAASATLAGLGVATTALVVGEGAGSKATSAEQLGIRIMPAAEFAALLASRE